MATIYMCDRCEITIKNPNRVQVTVNSMKELDGDFCTNCTNIIKRQIKSKTVPVSKD